MAAPTTINIDDVSGRWLLNRQLSQSTEAMFALQGIPWIIRKIINFATLELEYVKLDPTPDATAARLAFKQTVRPGGFDTRNEYILDGESRTDTVPIFGEISMRCHYVGSEEAAKHDAVGLETDADNAGHAAILEILRSEPMGWAATTVWGFEVIDGVRRFVKHNSTIKGEKVEKAKLVFDYLGPPQV
ncbi:hypothetical protein F5144DRAFT_523685 [Chaetomium tenue]|uniref:Uncharacterized protein n=1 Tax=Chaetomium tenue TaxID=1854479 RepID=A0ACB7PR26_9PEZI|nr:hypothetical protein F5144DRAFT_523685 [Chaetomium globosum]